MRTMTAPRKSREYRYYDFVMAAYVCVLLCSNLIGPAKETSIEVPMFGTVTFLAGVLFFPISYIFGDILTEVYGYGRDRRVVWAGFAALAFASLMAAVVVHLPPSVSSRDAQAAVEAGSQVAACEASCRGCGRFRRRGERFNPAADSLEGGAGAGPHRAETDPRIRLCRR